MTVVLIEFRCQIQIFTKEKPKGLTYNFIFFTSVLPVIMFTLNPCEYLRVLFVF